MFDKQVTALTAILKDKDIREYSGDAFWNRGNPSFCVNLKIGSKMIIFQNDNII